MYALFNESISQVYQSYISSPDLMDSIFDKVIVVEDGKLKNCYNYNKLL